MRNKIHKLIRAAKEWAKERLPRRKQAEKKSPETHRPKFVNISPTNRCNLSCKMCEIWSTHKRDQRKEMTAEQMKKVIDDLHGWLGKFTLNFAGGEPFTRPDMIEIMQYASGKCGDIYTTSNGMLLTEERCKALVNSGISGISISLDSTDPELHNQIRNSPIAFEKATAAIKNINKLRQGKKFSLTISTVFMGFNAKSMIPLLNFVEKEGLSGINYQPLMHTFGVEYHPRWHEESKFWPTQGQLDEIDTIIDELIRRKRAGSPIHNDIRHFEMMKKYFRNPVQHAKDACNVGYKNFSITEYGEALICYFFKPIGNVLETTPEELWKSMEAKSTREKISMCKRNCDLLNCNFD